MLTRRCPWANEGGSESALASEPTVAGVASLGTLAAAGSPTSAQPRSRRL